MSSRIDIPVRSLEVLWTDFEKQGLYLRNWSKTTLRTYRQAFSSFRCATPEHELNKQTLEAWVVWLRQKGLTPGGCNMYIRTMNSFLSWLKEHGELPGEFRLKLLPNPSKPLRGFSDNEIRSLLSFKAKGFIELRTWTLIQCLLDNGARIEEILTLRTCNTDMENMTITVKGKGNKVRQIPMSIEFRKILFRYIQLKERRGIGDGIVFSTKHGGRLTYRNTYRDIKWLCAKAGVSGPYVHPHAFRHHFAVTYIRRGGDIYRLSRILGHASISTTQIYLRSMGIEQIAENHSSLSPLSRQ